MQRLSCRLIAHPTKLKSLPAKPSRNGIGVIIAIAGLSAHLPGVLASMTMIPIIGVPVGCGALTGQDALYSIVQMPPGIPVASVGIDNGTNAALFAVEFCRLPMRRCGRKCVVIAHNSATLGYRRFFMMERIQLSSLRNEQPPYQLLNSLVQRIEDGAVFVYPTETIYGIGGRADSSTVKQKIIAAKTREPDNSMILVAGVAESFTPFNLYFAPAAIALARHFWPGNLTLVLPYNTTSGTLGIRVSDHPFIKLLYRKFMVPVFSTSANISGTEYQNAPDAIYETFKNRADIMVDAGVLTALLPSTIVSVSKNNDIEIIREGILSREDVLAYSAQGL